MLNSSHKAKRDLLTKMSSIRNIDRGPVVQRNYAYGKLGRPISRTQTYLQQKFAQEDSFDYNRRSELTGAKLGEAPYAYSYDNIGNRITAQEDAEHITYAANNLNQYTQIGTDGTAFVPEYDADGNQTRVRTSTGIWKVQYNGQNRAIRYESEADSTHIITCVYDSQGRRVEKKEEKEGAAISHVRYVYRGYLQVAAYDLLAEGLPSLWQIIWDPTQEIATRPLAIRKDGSFLTYGWDLTKNICETYTSDKGFLSERYTYSPFGLVSIEGDTSYQPLQWSSEVYDAELGLVYYNYRYYNPTDGRRINRDILFSINQIALYNYLSNNPILMKDILGLSADGVLEALAILEKETQKLLGRVAGGILAVFNIGQAVYQGLEAVMDVPECVKDERSLGIWMEKRRQLARSALSNAISGLTMTAATILSGGWAALASSAILGEILEFLESLVSDEFIDRIINAVNDDVPSVKCDCTYEVS